MKRSGAGHCQVKGQLCLRRPERGPESERGEFLRKDCTEEEGGGRAKAGRRVGGSVGAVMVAWCRISSLQCGR